MVHQTGTRQYVWGSNHLQQAISAISLAATCPGFVQSRIFTSVCTTECGFRTNSTRRSKIRQFAALRANFLGQQTVESQYKHYTSVLGKYRAGLCQGKGFPRGGRQVPGQTLYSTACRFAQHICRFNVSGWIDIRIIVGNGRACGRLFKWFHALEVLSNFVSTTLS